MRVDKKIDLSFFEKIASEKESPVIKKSACMRI